MIGPIELIGGPQDGAVLIVHEQAESIVIPVPYRRTVVNGENFFGYLVYQRCCDGKFRYEQTVGEPCEPFGAVWYG